MRGNHRATLRRRLLSRLLSAEKVDQDVPRVMCMVMCVTHISGRSSVLRTAAPASSQLRLTLVGGAGVGGEVGGHVHVSLHLLLLFL